MSKKTTKNVSSPITAQAMAIVLACFAYSASKLSKLGFIAENVRRHQTPSGRITTKVQNDALTRLFNRMRDTHNAFLGVQLNTLEYIKTVILAGDISASCEYMRDVNGRIIKADDDKRNRQWGTLQDGLKKFVFEIADVNIDKGLAFTKPQVTNILKTAGKYYLATVQAEARKRPRAVKVVKATPAPLAAAAAA